jgi:hypothetical protein
MTATHPEPKLPHVRRVAAFGEPRRGPIRLGWVVCCHSHRVRSVSFSPLAPSKGRGEAHSRALPYSRLQPGGWGPVKVAEGASKRLP